LDAYTFEGLVGLAAPTAAACQSWAIVGHSLGAHLAVGVAADRPAGLRSVVLLDGGFMDAEGLTEPGMPVRAGREEFISWMQTNELRCAGWETAIGEMGKIIGPGPTDVLATRSCRTPRHQPG
jgi:pimeloyl-ACP methyl ester carboxylesterase